MLRFKTPQCSEMFYFYHFIHRGNLKKKHVWFTAAITRRKKNLVETCALYQVCDAPSFNPVWNIKKCEVSVRYYRPTHGAAGSHSPSLPPCTHVWCIPLLKIEACDKHGCVIRKQSCSSDIYVIAMNFRKAGHSMYCESANTEVVPKVLRKNTAINMMTTSIK